LYMKLPIDRIADFDREENDWKVVVSESDPTEV
ncbi:MAG TPA: PaaI family thioesterase, partial [Actinobacteria bacterium]|nr:PaaI family thioesterase [Actinomycetota bacterium]